MTLTTLPHPHPHPHPIPKSSPKSRLRVCSTARSRAAQAGRSPVLAHYADACGRPREILALPGPGGSTLVVDRDGVTWGDRRLVAHLAADEPFENARLVCRDYLRDPAARRCRALRPEDLRVAPFVAGDSLDPATALGLAEALDPDDARDPDNARDPDDARDPDEALDKALDPAGELGLAERGLPAMPTRVTLRDTRGVCHRLAPVATGLSIPELRWCRRGNEGAEQPESVRDAIACMESYEPVRALTAHALAHHGDDPGVSVTVLRSELRRIDASRIVLNCGLRRAVLRAMRTEGVSLSEIAFRCGRVKRDGKGNASGETSWLARRVGISPEGGSDGEPTPWIHTDVLALIARDGLGISPHEVEL
jgi:hypothetical protein